MEVSFQELKCKQVINSVDGKCLGHITDVIFDAVTAKTLGFVVPNSSGGFLGLFKQNKDLFIPFDCICKIGVDVVLVELYISDNSKPKCREKDCYVKNLQLDSGNVKPQNDANNNKKY